MIAMTFQHPTPLYDDSYAVNSANNGPYGDAIMTELIPYLEDHFRIIRKSYARIVTGGSQVGGSPSHCNFIILIPSEAYGVSTLILWTFGDSVSSTLTKTTTPL
jgi:hypothetical protein